MHQLGKVLRVRGILECRGVAYNIDEMPRYVCFEIEENDAKTNNADNYVYLTFHIRGGMEILITEVNASGRTHNIEYYDYIHDEDVWMTRLRELIKWLGY